ncbi:MAG: FitA-like ribbon-helix-helix domain-containing protein [Burkholderiales bacterium]
MIQIRNVPDPIHRTLKARAAEEGLSLSDYLLRELRQIAARPTPAQMLERLSAREPVRTRESVAAMVRRERDAR